MNLIFPTLKLIHWGQLFALGILGALIAGLYGSLHDQVTYTLSSEYFTEFKFDQFYYLDRGQPVRWIVAEIGFLASWWVGFFAFWFLGRVVISYLTFPQVVRLCLRCLGLLLGCSFLFAFGAYLTRATEISQLPPDYLDYLTQVRKVINPLAFYQVGQIHNASYSGAFVGILLSLIYAYLRRRKAKRGEPCLDS